MQIEPTKYLKNMRKDKPTLVLMIASGYGTTDVISRHVIRRTWGGITEYEGVIIHRIFLFGKCPSRKSCRILTKEEQKYGDILKSNYLSMVYC